MKCDVKEENDDKPFSNEISNEILCVKISHHCNNHCF